MSNKQKNRYIEGWKLIGTIVETSVFKNKKSFIKTEIFN